MKLQGLRRPAAPHLVAPEMLEAFWSRGPLGFSGRAAYLVEAVEHAILEAPLQRWALLGPLREAHALQAAIGAAYRARTPPGPLCPASEHDLQHRLDTVALAMLKAQTGSR